MVELMVVLVLVGLTAGLALPRFAQWAAAAEERAKLEGLRKQIEALPRMAFFSGRGFTMAEAPLELPADWRIHSVKPIVYHIQGMTAGGEVLVYAGGRSMVRWRIVSPAGRVVEPAGP